MVLRPAAGIYEQVDANMLQKKDQEVTHKYRIASIETSWHDNQIHLCTRKTFE